MNDNPDYWKDLLGDDYNDDVMKILQNQNPPKNPTGTPVPGKPVAGSVGKGAGQDDEDDAERFYNYNPVSSPSGGVPGRPAGPDGPAPERNGSSKNKDDDFNVTFDFDGEYRDVPDDRPIKPRREKRTGCLGGILYAVFFICVSLLLASLLWLAATDVLGLGKPDLQVQVTVPQGFTIETVTDTLAKDGLIKYKFLFKIYADFSHAATKITAGTYELNKNYDYRALVYGLSAHGGKQAVISVTIPEGYSENQIFAYLESNKVCSADTLWEAATNYDFNYDFLDKSSLGQKHRLEGFLFPDTYKFYVGDTPNRVISKMLDNFKLKFTSDYVTRAKALGYSVHDIVTIASMIEKEAGNTDADRTTIASVIYNRLKSKDLPYLQIDATIYYAIAETGQKFSTDVNSPYNTYKVKGLPAGPISNPGVSAIKAALYPATTDYYYYALNKSGTHNFFKDKAAHQAFVNSSQYGG